jgi:hypothetical protein
VCGASRSKIKEVARPASGNANKMIRLGLCCIRWDEPIKFRSTTAVAIKRLSRRETYNSQSA